jgi:serine/threonine protein kinase
LRFLAQRSGLSLANGGYRFLGKIAESPRCDVSKAERQGKGQNVCIKSITLSNKIHQKMIQRELSAALRLKESKNIVKIEDWFLDWIKPISACLVMEFCDVNLSDFLYSTRINKSIAFPAIEIMNLIHNITEALVCLENAGVIHRDINTSNILLKAEQERRTWKLADFGSSCSPINSTCDGFCGSLLTASPEALKLFPLSSQSDIWSFGCVVWECVTLTRPFKCASILEFRRSSKYPSQFPIHEYLFPRPKGVSCGTGMWVILRFVRDRMLVPDHQKRASSRELYFEWTDSQKLSSCGSPVL